MKNLIKSVKLLTRLLNLNRASCAEIRLWLMSTDRAGTIAFLVLFIVLCNLLNVKRKRLHFVGVTIAMWWVFRLIVLKSLKLFNARQNTYTCEQCQYDAVIFVNKTIDWQRYDSQELCLSDLAAFLWWLLYRHRLQLIFLKISTPFTLVEWVLVRVIGFWLCVASASAVSYAKRLKCQRTIRLKRVLCLAWMNFNFSYGQIGFLGFFNSASSSRRTSV